MSLTSAMIEALASEGLGIDAIIRVAKASEKRADNTGAERQKRYRDNKASRNGVTSRRDPPNDNSSNPQEDLPQEAKASLPQGAKKQRCAGVEWPCPVGVNPNHWRDFLAARKRKRCVTTQSALDGVMKDLAEIADDEWPPGRLVEHAAAKGWASINDPRKPLNGTANGRERQPDHRASNPTLDILRAANAEIARSPDRQGDSRTGLALPSTGIG